MGAYLLIINIASFLLYGYDKICARHNRWRVPEATLLGIAVFGGSIGAYAGMMVFRHKTKKDRFRFGVPLILAIQAVLAVLARAL